MTVKKKEAQNDKQIKKNGINIKENMHQNSLQETGFCPSVVLTVRKK